METLKVKISVSVKINGWMDILYKIMAVKLEIRLNTEIVEIYLV